MKSSSVRSLIGVVALALSACGATTPDSTAPTTPPTPRTPSIAALTVVGEQMFPEVRQFGYFTECIDFPEQGAHQPSGNDYSACPITDGMRARMAETQAHFCCEQNPSPDRQIRVRPAPGGGLVTVLLVGGRAKAELVVTTVGGRLLVDDIPAKGDPETGPLPPVTFQAKPPSQPTAVPTAPPGPGSRTLKVPWYHQAFELSCEEASLRMALAHEGIVTTDAAVLDIIGTDLRPAYFDSTGMHWGDPFATFVGNVNGSEIALTGYGTYYPTIAHAATALGGIVLQAGQGIAPTAVYAAVLGGHPVVVWVTYKWVIQHRRDYVAFDGKTVTYAGPGEHAVVVIGVTPTHVLINNPWSGPEWISKSTFERVYAIYDDMAVIVA